MSSATSGLALNTIFTQIKTQFPQAVQANIHAFKSDKLFAGTLVVALAGAGYVGINEAGKYLGVGKKLKAELRKRQKEAKARKQKLGEADAKKKKKKGVKIFNAKFRHQLMFLLKIGLNKKGKFLLGVQFFLLAMRTLITIRATSLNVFYLTKAIAQGSWKWWVRWVVHFFGWMMAGTAVNTGLKYIERLIALGLRKNLTARAHELYMSKNSFYDVNVMKKGGLDNVDQRIVANIDSFAKNCADLYGHSFKPILEFGFAIVLASRELGWQRPAALFAWNIVLDSFLRAVSPKISPLINIEEKLEGDFRAAHGRLTTNQNAEAIALLQGSQVEKEILDTNLKNVIQGGHAHALVRMGKDYATQVFKFQGLLAGGMFVHIPFLLQPELNAVDRIASFRSTEVLMLRCGQAFSEVLLLDKSIQTLAGYTSRVYDMIVALEESQKKQDTVLRSPNCDNIRLDNVSIAVPDPGLSDSKQRPLLIKDLSVSVEEGKSLVVTGPNGSGKSTLFRVLAGLWPAADGEITTPPMKDLMWLPQNSYIVMGTVRDQVTYPHRNEVSGPEHDAKVLECLKMAGLDKFITNGAADLDVVHKEWSGGEKQRIGFARVYYHRPKYALLDECTAAVSSEDNGDGDLYAKVLEHTIILSIAHRPELKKFHDVELKVAGNGTGQWKLRTIPAKDRYKPE